MAGAMAALAARLPGVVEGERRRIRGYEKDVRTACMRRLDGIAEWQDLLDYYEWSVALLTATAERHRRRSVFAGVVALVFFALGTALTVLRIAYP